MTFTKERIEAMRSFGWLSDEENAEVRRLITLAIEGEADRKLGAKVREACAGLPLCGLGQICADVLGHADTESHAAAERILDAVESALREEGES